tara:strand:- start:276 stop:578 length:303 start_codon:yes stop_codon:yes gene_type:complete
LDSIFENYYADKDNVYIKIDAQGYEKSILDGAEKSLENVSVLQIELSLVPLYQNSPIYTDMIEYLKTKGFELYGIEPGFSDQASGRLLQFDGVFVKNKLI